MKTRSRYEMPLWLKIFMGLVALCALGMCVAGLTGWDPLHLLGDPL